MGVFAVLALLVLGRSVFGRWCRYHAARDLDVWALHDAQKWLDRAGWLNPQHPDTELMRAQCFRQLGDMKRREAALELAKQRGASPQALQSELTLGQIQNGELGKEASQQFDALVAAGVSTAHIYAACINGALARENLTLATELVDAWERISPNHPHVLCLRGVLHMLSADRAGARAAFEKTLAIEPRHESARLSLAEMDETEHHVAAAIDRFLPLAEAHPENEIIGAGLARSLRKAGRLAQAKSVLEPLASQPDVPFPVACEISSVELELGNYRAAKEWLDRAAAASPMDEKTLTDASITFSMLGETIALDVLLAELFDRKAENSLVDDLKTHVAMHPRDEAAAAQLQKSVAQIAARPAAAGPYVVALQTAATQQQREAPGRYVYRRECSACHGLQGDAGRAAKHMFPRPRNLRVEPMRLVSTQNGVPTAEDIRTVIQAGIPGTAMVALDRLSAHELDLLVEVVQEMRREGVREQYLAQLRTLEEEPVEDDVRAVVQLQTTPGDVVAVPELGPADDRVLKWGQQLYVEQACQSCHGDTGTGDQTMPLFDVAGRPDFPRDLVHDVFKGGNQPASIYRRILLGMPGTPHPASVTMTTEELIALTHYCHALEKEPKHMLTNHQRALQACRRPAVQWPE